jgi:hypothetical protein
MKEELRTALIHLSELAKSAENVRKIHFEEGAQFILDKNLAVQFTKWKDLHFSMMLNQKYTCFKNVWKNGYIEFCDGPQYELITIYDYWINNVYGH